MTALQVRWADVLRDVVDRSHLSTGDQLSPLVESMVSRIGLTATVYLVDLAQTVLTPVHPRYREPVEVETGAAGQAYQLGEVVAARDERGGRLLWIPMLDGTERAGVLRIGLGEVVDDETLRRNVWSLAGLLGHIIMAKLPYSDVLRGIRNGGLSMASELMWQLVPPRTMATDEVVITALLEPFDTGGGRRVRLLGGQPHRDVGRLRRGRARPCRAPRHGAGHDCGPQRPRSGSGRSAVAGRADDAARRARPRVRFVTAVLARLDTRTGVLELPAGRAPAAAAASATVGGQGARSSAAPPLGVGGGGPEAVATSSSNRGTGCCCTPTASPRPATRTASSSASSGSSTSNALSWTGCRRPRHCAGWARPSSAPGRQLQDDATLLMVDWSAATHERLFPGDL